MKVAFDQQAFVLQEYGGISRYLCNLAKSFAQMEGVEARIFAPLHFNKNLDAMQGLWDPLESTCRHASLSIL